MRTAILDLGTNTFNLLIAGRGEGGGLRVLHSEERAVFLGRGGIEQGRMTEEAMARGMRVLGELVAVARAQGANDIRGFGTSALRNARNADRFIRAAREHHGVEVRVIPGEEEAALILDGVRQAVTFTGKPMLVMDIGGGSIEFILATHKALMWKHSFELGATRLLERFRPSDPITLEEHFRVGAYLDAQLEPLFAVMDRHWPTALVGSAGAFDTLAQLVAEEQGATLAPEAVTSNFDHTVFDLLKERLLGTTAAQRSCMPAIPPFRVDTLPLGLIAIERVLLQGIEELRWSRYALKEGAAWRMLTGGH